KRSREGGSCTDFGLDLCGAFACSRASLLECKLPRSPTAARYGYGMGSIRLTREQLYEMVWERPLQQVAPELGISDVALAKICKKLDVPRPYRGYWVRRRAGRRPKRRPLPRPRSGMRLNYDVCRWV